MTRREHLESKLEKRQEWAGKAETQISEAVIYRGPIAVGCIRFAVIEHYTPTGGEGPEC